MIKDANLKNLSEKLPFNQKVQDLDITLKDYRYYVKQVVISKDDKELKYITGKDLKAYAKERQKKPIIDLDDNEIFLLEESEVTIRRSIENAVFRAIGYKDKTIRLVNNLMGVYIDEKDCNRELLLKSLRASFHPALKKVLEILGNEAFTSASSLRNAYIHSGSMVIEGKKDGEETILKINLNDSWIKKEGKDIKEIIALLEAIDRDINKINALLISGANDRNKVSADLAKSFF